VSWVTAAANDAAKETEDHDTHFISIETTNELNQCPKGILAFIFLVSLGSPGLFNFRMIQSVPCLF